MTESTNETPTRLVQHSIYKVSGAIYIAVDEENLVGIVSHTTTPFKATGSEELLYPVGSHEWIIKMVQVRANLVAGLQAATQTAESRSEYIENLGQAILEKAIEHEWCEEYDEFAEEWDLPLRRQEYDVVVSVRVLAKNSEAAEELVAENFSLSHYSDGVVSGPEFSSDRAY